MLRERGRGRREGESLLPGDHSRRDGDSRRKSEACKIVATSVVVVFLLVYVMRRGDGGNFMPVGSAIVDRDVQIFDDQDRQGLEPKEGESHVLPVKVCVYGPNPRVSSIFVTNYLQLHGSAIEFVMGPDLARYVQSFLRNGALHEVNVPNFGEACDPEWPVVRLVFQRDLQPSKFPPKETIIIVGDEYCKCPMNICGSPTCKRVAFRQYYHSAFRTPYIPLGPRFEFSRVEASEIKGPNRQYLFNFIGAPTSGSRKVLKNILITAREGSGVLSKGFVHFTPSWKKDATSDGYIAPAEYRQVLLDSTFTLCPAGTNPEAFRIYEAIDSGSIPIFVRDEEYENHECGNSFFPLLQGDHPFIVLRQWSMLEDKLNELQRNHDSIDLMQKKMMKWRDEFWRSVLRDVEKAVFDRFEGDLDKSINKEDCGASPPPKPSIAKQQAFASTPLITGCGRSGTHSLMTFLKSIGVKAVHEAMKKDHVSVSWLYAAESMSYPFENFESAKYRKMLMKQKPQTVPLFSPVVHLTRHPLKVMSSTRRCFCGRGDRELGAPADRKSWEFAARFLPRMNERLMALDSLERSAIYWLEWNKMIDRRFPDAKLIRLEDLDPVELVKSLDLSDEIELSLLPKSVPRSKFHTSPDKERERVPDITWAELRKMNEKIAQEILDLAQMYGYDSEKSLDDLI